MRLQSYRTVGVPAVLFVAFSIGLLAQKSSPAFPRDGARNVLDNDNVAAWDVTWPKGKPTQMFERQYDQVTVTLAEGTVKTTRADKTSTMEYSRFGTVSYEPKGTAAAEEGVSDRPRRAIVFEIKSYTTPAVAPDVAKFLKEKKAAGIPGHLDGSNGGVKLFENEKMSVWQKTWNPRGILHAHYAWIAGVWIQPGVLGGVPAGSGPLPPCPIEKMARTPEGWPRAPLSPDECQASDATVALLRSGTNISEFGEVRWGAPGNFHQEEGLGFPGYSPAAMRAIFIEFKEGPLTRP